MATRTSSKGRKIVTPANFSTDSEVELQQSAFSQMRDNRFLFYYGKNAFSTALNSSSWPQGTSWKHKLSLERGQAYPIFHNDLQPECIYLGKGSRTEISRHKLVVLAQLQKENLQVLFRRHFFVTSEMRRSIQKIVKLLSIPLLRGMCPRLRGQHL